MFKLFKENVRIAFESIRSQILRTILTVLIIAIGITALVGILSAVSALENTISSDFASMGSNTFNLQRYEFVTQSRGGGETEKINPILTYREVREFKDEFIYPKTQTSLSFNGTGNAEVKFENEKTDPEVSVIGVNENFLTNSGLDLENGREFTFFDIQNNNKVTYLEHFSKHQMYLFNISLAEIKLVAVKVENEAIDITTRQGYQWLQSNLLDDTVNLYTSTKALSEDRNKDIFALIKQGAVITKGDLFEYFNKMVENSPFSIFKTIIK